MYLKCCHKHFTRISQIEKSFMWSKRAAMMKMMNARNFSLKFSILHVEQHTISNKSLKTKTPHQRMLMNGHIQRRFEKNDENCRFIHYTIYIVRIHIVLVSTWFSQYVSIICLRMFSPESSRIARYLSIIFVTTVIPNATPARYETIT